MIKRTPSRSTRSRGFRVKHVLQICLLLGVCFWLLYQVKHSHDKKKEFDEKDSKVSVRSQNANEIADFGRKGLHPRFGGVIIDDKHEEDDDEETVADDEENKIEENRHEEKQVIEENNHGEERGEGTEHAEDEPEEQFKDEEDEGEEREKEGNKHEEDEKEEGNRHDEKEREEEEENTHEEEEKGGNKHEDEDQEEETKSDETEDEGRGGGDDELDERDQQKIEAEADREEAFVEEQEREEGTEKERGENKEDVVDSEASTEDQDHDGRTNNDHVARDVHYQADDASGAVTHDTQNIGSEPKNTSGLNLESNSGKNDPMNINGDQKNSTSQLKEGAMAENDHALNMKTEEKGDETIKTDYQSLKTATADPHLSTNKSMDVNAEANSNTTGGNTGASSSSQQRETLVTSDSNEPQNKTVDGANNVEESGLKTTESEQVNNNIVSGGRQSDSTLTVSDKTEDGETVAKDSNSSSNLETDGSNKTIKAGVTSEAEVNSGSSSMTKETEDTAQVKHSDIKNESGGTDDNSGSSTADGTGADVHDTIDSSDSSIGQDVKEAHKNLDTLPENSAEGVNSRDTAAE